MRSVVAPLLVAVATIPTHSGDGGDETCSIEDRPVFDASRVSDVGTGTSDAHRAEPTCPLDPTQDADIIYCDIGPEITKCRRVRFSDFGENQPPSSWADTILEYLPEILGASLTAASWTLPWKARRGVATSTQSPATGNITTEDPGSTVEREVDTMQEAAESKGDANTKASSVADSENA